MAFSNQEKLNMLQMFYLAHRSPLIASNNYLEAYPERRQPHSTMFLRLERNLRDHGSFTQGRQRYQRRIMEDNTPNILQQVCGFIFCCNPY